MVFLSSGSEISMGISFAGPGKHPDRPRKVVSAPSPVLSFF